MKPCIIFIMGVAGSGKTTVGLELSQATGIPFFDADDFHPASNKEKMKAGLPLDDNDRLGWLASLNTLAKEEANKQGAIIACSALKAIYRAVLTEAIQVPVHWVLLHGEFSLIRDRIQSRKGHFMPASLLQSQFETLEMPTDAIVVDIKKTPTEIVAGIQHRLGLYP